jgi:bifunctional non-homologous end joining protein LigD
VVGWTDPEARRSHFGAPLLAYYDPGGRLIYAGRVGTGIDNVELERLWRRLQPLTTTRCRSTCRRRAVPALVRRWC